tara:strand:- start:290 stop:808 length:519 start_codon:yes stop_codon:yes gene_type:complete
MFFSKPYNIFKVKNHLKNKERILMRMSTTGHPLNINGCQARISKTDWGNTTTEWYSFALSQGDRELYEKLISKKYKCNIAVVNSWFNQYDPYSASSHPWHDHPHSELTNVYFVELEDKSLGTVLKNPKTGKDINVRVEEGQILTFHASIMHKSPKNLTNSRKTVISFNTRFV